MYLDNEVVVNKDEPVEDEEEDWEDEESFIEEETKGEPDENKMKVKKEQEELTEMMKGLTFSDNPVIYEPPEKPKKKKDPKKDVKPYIGNNKGLAKGEALEFDNQAYEMFHRATTEWSVNQYSFPLFFVVVAVSFFYMYISFIPHQNNNNNSNKSNDKNKNVGLV